MSAKASYIKVLRQTTVLVDCMPFGLNYVARYVMNGMILRPNSSVTEQSLGNRGITETSLEEYLNTLVQIRVAFVADQLNGHQVNLARKLMVPSGFAQSLACIGDVEVGPWTIRPRALPDEIFKGIQWDRAKELSERIEEIRQVLHSVNAVTVAGRNGEPGVMSLIVKESNSDDVVLGLHTNSTEPEPVHETMAVVLGLKLASDGDAKLYALEATISGWRSGIRFWLEQVGGNGTGPNMQNP